MRQPRLPGRWRVLMLSALAGVALVPVGLAGAAQAAYSGANGRIAFVRGGDIYTITPGGTGLHRLTSNGHSASPRWSPTGQRIAYLRNGNLWIMNADGSHQGQVTNAAPASTDARPTWSPNGRYLAFVKTAHGRSSGLLTRYDTVAGKFRTFVTSAESGALKVSALPTAVAWQWTAEGDSALLYEATGKKLCPPHFKFCLAAVTFPSQSSYTGGDPSLEYAHSNTTRFRDPDSLGATELWNLGGVVGLAIAGAPFFLGEPEGNGWDTPASLGSRTVRVEVFVDDPDGFIERAVAAGADGSADQIRDHEAPWGVHRQGGFIDPFGHLWLVGDRSPLQRYN